MSYIPYTTQYGPQAITQRSQGLDCFVLIHLEKMSERQALLMCECQRHLNPNIKTESIKIDQLDSIPKSTRLFVIPRFKEDLVRKIKDVFEKPLIYLPRAIIEARSFHNVALPTRSLSISLTMYNCRVFLVKSCGQSPIRNRINEMCGTVLVTFNDRPGLLITDRADDKYCAKAAKQKIPIVSREWVDENYNIASQDDAVHFNHVAMTNVEQYQIKPFYGLHFKLMVPNSPQLKQLILSNQGNIIYGNENSLTHVVVLNFQDSDNGENGEINSKDGHKPKTVDVEFLKACAEHGYYIPRREYREMKTTASKPEVISTTPLVPKQATTDRITRAEENILPNKLSNGHAKPSENQAMLPPPHVPRPPRQQSDNMSDMILRALSDTQTQLASTQMRRLPDPELRIEQTFEPSQQLYWNDNVSRRN